MVGHVLMDRMNEEGDLSRINPDFFSTSTPGQKGPQDQILKDAFSIDELSQMDIICTCQGSDYTNKVYPELKRRDWNGYWLDSSSAMRMNENAVIILDPVNGNVIDRAIDQGIKIFVGGNCTVSLMLMAIGGLFKENLVDWVSTMTYQAASGAGARHMFELMDQMSFLAGSAVDNKDALSLGKLVQKNMEHASFPTGNFNAPLAASLIPWIDDGMKDGRTKEEWKGEVELNKILGLKPPVPVDGICVRVGAFRSHSQALTIKLKRDVSIASIEDIVKNSNKWVKVIPNEKKQTLDKLTPAAVSGTLDIPVGRMRKMTIGKEYLTLFTVGDQLLWGAAEPIRRMLGILCR